MKKYNLKKLSDVTPFEGYSQAETAHFIQNGISEMELPDKFPDLYQKIWLDIFLNSMSTLKLTDEFVRYIEKNSNKKFCIVGDYDVDGTMATTIIKATFDKLNIHADYVIPDRLEDVYGMTPDIIDRVLELGSDIIITVDNGIGTNEACEYAYEKGLEVVITDHHLPEGDLPKAELIIDPHLNEDDFPNICGAFVAFKLMKALLDSHGVNDTYFIRDMATLAMAATVADVMPLIGENRVLVKTALDSVNFLKDKKVWSSLSLKFMSGFSTRYLKEDSVLTESHISFSVAPMINAQGRINGDATKIVDEIMLSLNNNTFITKDFRELNYERRRRVNEIMENVVLDPETLTQVIFINPDEYDYNTAGILGLVSNNTSQKTNHPVFAGTWKNERFAFSGRSPRNDYSLFDAVKRIADAHPEIDIKFGGHANAMGMNVSTWKEVQEFTKLFEEDYRSMYDPEKETLEDVFLYEPVFHNEIFEAGEALSPFGKDFEKITYILDGTLESLDIENRSFTVDGLQLSIFNNFDALAEVIGKKIRVVFQPEFDKKIAYFRASDWETLN